MSKVAVDGRGMQAIGRSTGRAWLAIVLAALTPFVTTGCSSSAPKSSGLDQATSAYWRGDFKQARTLAETAERQSTGVKREEAAYLAGLASARMGDLDAAEAKLREAADSSDRDLASRASVSLGSVARAQGEDAKAAAAYRQAAVSPDRSIRSRATTLAGGGADLPSSGPSASPSSISSTSSTSSGTRFTIQAGAFGGESTARDRARELAPLARQAGLGAPQVRPIRAGDGRALWAVQIGEFPNRVAAGSARDRLGHPTWAIESVGGS